MSPYKLVVDARCVRAGATGVGHYTACMLQALGEAGVSIDALVLASQKPPHPTENVRYIPVTQDYESHPSGDWFEHVTLPRMVNALRPDAFWGPSFHVPWRGLNCPSIVTIHDMTAFTHPQHYPRGFGAYVRFITGMAVRRSTTVITDSHDAKREMLRRFPQVESKLSVVYSGGDHLLIEVEPSDTDPPPTLLPPEVGAKGFALTLSAGDPRKNTEWLCELWRAGIRRGDWSEPLLVLGQTAAHTGEGVIVMPRQPRVALRSLMKQSRLLVVPSVAEGFCMPIVEAFSAGTPVLASDIPVLREIGGDVVFSLNIRDNVIATEQVRECLATLRENESVRTQRQAAGLQRAELFSWQNSAKQFLNVVQAHVRDT